MICARCIYDHKTPGILFDGNGVCNYCKLVDSLQEEYQTGTEEGERRFLEIVERIKAGGRKKKYDCVVGVSGGTDSSFMLYKAVQLGLRPLAVHYDNTWNSATATENIRKVTRALGVDLFTHVVDNKEMDDIYRSFLFASVPEIDGPTDIALAETLYRAAARYGVRYVLEGHSFRTEGVSPLAIMYIDGKYIEDIQRRFGTQEIKTFPNMTLTAFVKWMALKQIRRIRPLWYIAHSKEASREFLEREFGWRYYGGHHLENRMTAFHHSYYLPRKVGIDQRNNSLSAAVRVGELTRGSALESYRCPPHIEAELIPYVKKRLCLSDDEFERIMEAPLKTYRDYRTYKRTFERLRPFFWLMYKLDRVPKSFYVKYTSRAGI